MSSRQSIGIPPIVVLHRYWIHANAMRIHFEEELRKKPPNTSDQKDARKIFGDAVMYAADKRGTFISYCYGALYVVIEGWKQLRLTDAKIDRLISSPNVRLLKKYRDGVFHFQRNYFDDRFVDFFRSQDWVRAIHSELGRYFLEQAAARNKQKHASLNRE
jgi:hypothetical protein